MNEDMSAQASGFARITVGGTAEEDAAAFLDAVGQAERGESVDERVLSFQSWEGLASVMTGERYRLLRHLHAHPEPSVSALARALGRQYRRVHEDVAVLEGAGLVVRDRADPSHARARKPTTDAAANALRLGHAEASVSAAKRGVLRVTADMIQAEIRL